MQIVSKMHMPYDEDMKRKYAKHLRTTERYAVRVSHDAISVNIEITLVSSLHASYAPDFCGVK